MESARFQGAGAAEHSHLTEHHAASSDRAACPAGAGSSGACHLNGVCSPEAPTPARSPGRQGSRTRGRPVPGTPGGPYKGKGRPSQAAHQRRGTRRQSRGRRSVSRIRHLCTLPGSLPANNSTYKQVCDTPPSHSLSLDIHEILFSLTSEVTQGILAGSWGRTVTQDPLFSSSCPTH